MSEDKTQENELTEHEWSVFIDCDKISEDGKVFNISPEESEIEALCKRLDLYGIEKLNAQIKVKRHAVNKSIHVVGAISSDLQQKCVITRDPVDEIINEEFDAWYAEESNAVSFAKAKRERMSPKERNEQPILDEEEDPEPVINGKIDIGELVVQHLSLALNPYPRAEGAVFDSAQEGKVGLDDEAFDNPFAALKDWKKSEKDS